MATTKHNTPDGKPLPFGKRCSIEANCPRCAELNDGAAPVTWQGNRRAEDDRQETAFRDANRAKGLCICGKPKNHGICTYGDW